MSSFEDAFDFDTQWARDCDREPTRHARRGTSQLDPRGTVRITYDPPPIVCPESEHAKMKLDGRFDRLPGAPRAEYIAIDFEDGAPIELHRYANCSCTSTLAKVVDTSDSPTWLESLRRAGLL